MGAQASKDIGDESQELRESLSKAGLSDDRLCMGMTALLRARDAVVSHISVALEPMGLTTSEFLVISTLAVRRERGVRLGLLANAVLLHPTTVTQLIDALEDKGMVERKPDPKDRRSIRAVLTKAGWTTNKKAIATLDKIDFGLTGITPEGANLILNTLEPIKGGLWSSKPYS